MSQTLDWKRVRGALFHEARRRGISETKTEETLALLPRLIGMCGDYSHSRKVAGRLGSLLMGTDAPEVIVPTCPAYPNREGRYHRVGTLGSGVSLLTRLHLPFLRRLAELVPAVRVTILVADFEAEDRVIRRATGLTRSAFIDRVRATAAATRALVKPYGWDARLFSEFIPTFAKARAEAAECIRAEPEFLPQLRADTLSRQSFYRLYYPRATFGKMMGRTVKAAAEYTVLGREAAARGTIIVNHTTSSLAWYARTDAAFLQNPIRTY